jgi:hypothetical protein
VEKKKKTARSSGAMSPTKLPERLSLLFISLRVSERCRKIYSLLSKYLYFYYGLKLLKKDFIKFLSRNEISHIENVL